jgi:hypothetical protein
VLCIYSTLAKLSKLDDTPRVAAEFCILHKKALKGYAHHIQHNEYKILRILWTFGCGHLVLFTFAMLSTQRKSHLNYRNLATKQGIRGIHLYDLKVQIYVRI